MTITKPNQINPNKLLLSKWTAVKPQDKEKHFLVTDVIKNELEIIVGCVLEAVLTRHQYAMDWQVLKNSENWLAGWR